MVVYQVDMTNRIIYSITIPWSTVPGGFDTYKVSWCQLSYVKLSPKLSLSCLDYASSCQLTRHRQRW